MAINRNGQSGASVTGVIIILLVAIVLGAAALKIIPPFMDYSTVKTVLQSVLQDPRIATKAESEIISDIDRRFNINSVTVIRANEVMITKTATGVQLSVDYEVRTNFYKNIDFLITFQQDFSKDSR